jgi:nitrate/nitrite transporter NarK
MAVGTLTQFMTGAFGPIWIPALDLSRTDFGIVTATFFAASALLSPAAGWASDRFGGQPVAALTFLSGGLAFGAMAAAGSAVGLIAGAAIAGVAGAAANPSTNLLVAEHARTGRRGLLIGIKQSGVQVGAFTAGLLPAAAGLVGWRAVLVVCAALSLAGVALATGTLRTRATRHTAMVVSSPSGPVADHISRWLVPYAVLMGIAGAAVSSYLPLHAVEVAGFSPARAGLLAAAIGLVGIPARILWARGTEHRASTGAALAIIAGGGVASLLLLLADAAGWWSSLWLAALVFGGTAAAWNAVAMLAIIDRSDARIAGRVSGRVLTGFYVGLVIGPVPLGYTVDRTGSYIGGWATVAGIYAVAGAIALAWDRRTVR